MVDLVSGGVTVDVPCPLPGDRAEGMKGIMRDETVGQLRNLLTRLESLRDSL
jgi:hypothetical protein